MWGQAVTLEEMAEQARTAAQIVLDREWYTPGTLKALGGGKLGPPPFLALVFDDAKEEVMWFGQSAEGFGKRNKYLTRVGSSHGCLARPVGSTFGRQLDHFSGPFFLCKVVNRWHGCVQARSPTGGSRSRRRPPRWSRRRRR